MLIVTARLSGTESKSVDWQCLADWKVAVETKQQILKAIEDLPDDAGVEDALDQLYLLYKVERGLRQADQGELLTPEEVRERMARWLK